MRHEHHILSYSIITITYKKIRRTGNECFLGLWKFFRVSGIVLRVSGGADCAEEFSKFKNL